MELTCYLHPAWAPRLRPASRQRTWMDATPERFAYRCLPLAIANAHGWEVGSPCGFRARWNGGMGAEAVEIEYDAGSDAQVRPVSLFGAGTVTFHVEGLFRTPPGWNLWVGGPPNGMKPAMAPLAGVIETDWSPYTFTMNWRFTAVDTWVRFDEDEAFCFFFPVERGIVDRMTPVIRPVSEAPVVEAAFAQWSASRDAFQEHVRRTQPEAPADKWQKLYYRGVMPDGTAGPADHQSKLRVDPFEPRHALGCPVTGHTAHPPPPPTAPVQSTPDLLAANLVHPEAMALALRSIGFDGETEPCTDIAVAAWTAGASAPGQSVAEQQLIRNVRADMPAADRSAGNALSPLVPEPDDGAS